MKAEQFVFNDQTTKQGTMNLLKMNIFGVRWRTGISLLCWTQLSVRVGSDPDNLWLCDRDGHTITHPGRVIQHDNDSDNSKQTFSRLSAQTVLTRINP